MYRTRIFPNGYINCIKQETIIHFRHVFSYTLTVVSLFFYLTGRVKNGTQYKGNGRTKMVNKSFCMNRLNSKMLNNVNKC